MNARGETEASRRKLADFNIAEWKISSNEATALDDRSIYEIITFISPAEWPVPEENEMNGWWMDLSGRIQSKFSMGMNDEPGKPESKIQRLVLRCAISVTRSLED